MRKNYYEVIYNSKTLKKFNSFPAAKQFRKAYAENHGIPISEVEIDLLHTNKFGRYCYQGIQLFKNAKQILEQFDPPER